MFVTPLSQSGHRLNRHHLGLTRGGPREILRLRSQTRSAQDDPRDRYARLSTILQFPSLKAIPVCKNSQTMNGDCESEGFRGIIRA